MSARAFAACIMFLLGFSWMMAELTHTTTQLLSPLTLGLSGGLLAVVIGASSTPIAKGVAMVALFLDLTLFFFYSNVDPLILGLVIAPIVLTLGMSMAELGKS